MVHRVLQLLTGIASDNITSDVLIIISNGEVWFGFHILMIYQS